LNSTDGLLLAAPLVLTVRSPKEKAVRCRWLERDGAATVGGCRGLAHVPRDIATAVPRKERL